jgi:hypothetical protein
LAERSEVKAVAQGTLSWTLLGLLGIAATGPLAPASHEGEGKRKSSSAGGASGEATVERTPIEKTPIASSSASGFDRERVWSGYDDWEPAVAVDPGGAYVYQLTTRYSGPAACEDCPFPVIVFRSSVDGGNTWGPDRFLATTRKRQNDPQIAVAQDGTVYAAWLDQYTPGVKFIKSSNHGASWSAPIRLTAPQRPPNWSDRPILAASADGRDVYVAFNASDSYVTSSHDRGARFGDNVKTSDDTRYWFHSAGAVAPNGDVYFATVDFSQSYLGDAHIGVLRSTDRGASWTTTRLDTSRQLPGCNWAAGCYFGFLGSSAGLAIDPDGTILVAYGAGVSPGAPQQIYARTSVDGERWSPRTQLSDPSSAVNSGFPAVAAGRQAGEFRVVWQDDRNLPERAWNTWHRRTVDGGLTWDDPTRLSDLGSGAPYKKSRGYRFPYGDYLGIAVDAAGAPHFVWGEGDSYSGPGGTWYTKSQ